MLGAQVADGIDIIKASGYAVPEFVSQTNRLFGAGVD